ncbi:AEC family transporter [Amorphus orientalis]|uniref:Permease n=1 Tax=Amorphus orientalis TaxID=649198 RepID=A0AAE3VNC5_9HYPH|nr:AEC family transporter [Amorphus orientalis]MDQ0315227.1 putative permease [Amorphus orientalis]
MSTDTLIGVILPVFGLIGIGYLVARFGLVSDAVGDALAEFVFKVCLPLLLFRTLATLGWPETSPWPIWLTYFAGVAIIWTIAAITIRRVFGRDARSSVVAGMAAGYSNLVLLGIAVIDQAFGEAGLVDILVLVSVHLPIMLVASEILTERAERKDGLRSASTSPLMLTRRVALTLLLSPLLIGMMAGIAYNVSGLPFAGLPADLIERIADIAIPMALLSLGMGLKKYGIRGAIVPAAAIGMIKILVFPAIVYLIAAYVVGLPDFHVAVLTISAACPTGVNAYLIANRIGTGQALSANALTLTTVASMVSISVWLAVLGY